MKKLIAALRAQRPFLIGLAVWGKQMDDELLQAFIDESREHLVTIEADLLAIEEAGDEADPELVNKVFRAAHSIKGCSSFFGLDNVKELSHKAETVLDLLRSRKMRPSSEMTNVLLAAFDKLKELVEAPGTSEQADISSEIKSLTELARPYLAVANATSAQSESKDSKSEEKTGSKSDAVPQTTVEEADEVTKQHSSPAALVQSPHAEEVTTAESVRGNEGLHQSGATENNSQVPEESVRVTVGLLDGLMNLAGELVLSRNQFQAAIAHNNHRMLTAAGQRLSQVTSEIQDAIMRTRLQPIENVFNKIPRVVRDLSKMLGKEVHLEVLGKDVALDKSLVEGLSDPLTHMVRNAVDHGIESPEERVQAGKARGGMLRIEARHEAGQVVIEISDDGKGIDAERVSQVAVEKGLITREQVKGMSERDRMALICLPGLSTAEKISEVSGRGVGMDVVKTNLERLGGQIEINSTLGRGTTFRIKLPLTLTIIPALIVSVEDERFAIPQVNVEELLRVRPEEAKQKIEVIGNTEVLLLRDRVLPLLRLDSFLGVQRTFIDPETGERKPDRRTRLADRRSVRETLEGDRQKAAAKGPIVMRNGPGHRYHAASALEIAVITTGTFQYGLVVSAFHNTEEIVVKPLGRDLKELREYAGATVLGDGAVALILDTAGLATKGELTSVSASARAKEMEEKSHAATEADANRHSLLLFRNAPEEHCAVLLEAVRRIERIKPEQVESAGGKRTVKYRDKSLPLVALSDTAALKPLKGAKDLAVIVTDVYGHEVGLLGAMPVDVVETAVQIDQSTHRQKGIAGSAVIHGHTTMLADLNELVAAAYPEWDGRSRGGAVRVKRGIGVLLAEDSDFFRAQVHRFFDADGYDVIEARDGEEAWNALLRSPEKVQIVVTDLEMPRMTGIELTKHIRADARFSPLPVIALTSLAAEEDIARGKSVGIDDYQIKLDRDHLLEAVERLTGHATQDHAEAV